MGQGGVDVALGNICPQVDVVTDTPYQAQRADQLIVTAQLAGFEACAIGIVQFAVHVILAQAGGKRQAVAYLPLVL